MSFLSIAFLAALPLAAAPLLLHFFDRRRNVVIGWGAMQFLQQAATRRTSARSLKEWLLLLMRIVALLALIVALARPLAPGNWFGTRDRTETIVVLDNSMLLTRQRNDVALSDELLERATRILDETEAGNSVRLMLSSPYPVWLTPGSVRFDVASKSELMAKLTEVRPTAGSSDLLASLLIAVQADAEPSLHQRRIVPLTDGQSTDWRLDDRAAWRRFQDMLSAAPTTHARRDRGIGPWGIGGQRGG